MTKEAMTPEAAKARLVELRNDAGFQNRIFSNDADAKREWEELIRVAAGHAPPTGTPQTRLNTLMADPAARERRRADDIQAKQEFETLIRTLAEGPGQ